MTEAHIKQELSISYMKAISASAGMTCEIRGIDYGIDGSIHDIVYDARRRAYRDSSFGIDFQLKSTVNAHLKNDTFLYDLESKNYLDLINMNVGRSRILILYVLPRDKMQWVEVSHTETIIKKCAYWCSLRGLPEVENTNTVRIKVPANQLLTSDELKRLMGIVKGGGWL